MGPTFHLNQLQPVFRPKAHLVSRPLFSSRLKGERLTRPRDEDLVEGAIFDGVVEKAVESRVLSGDGGEEGVVEGMVGSWSEGCCDEGEEER